MNFLSNHKRAFMIIASIVLLITIIATIIFRERPSLLENVLGYALTPIQSNIYKGKKWAGEKIGFLTSITDLEAENQSLKQMNDLLTEEVKRLKLAEAENIKLSELFEIDQKYAGFDKVGAEIITKDPGNWYNRFVINKGSNDGLNKNMVVLGSGGLLGRIIESGATYSKVVSLIDIDSSIAVKSVRTEDRGFVKGDLKLMTEGLCIMEFIDNGAEIIEGDEIVTSNLSGIYPPGISIGFVKEILVDSKGFNKTAIIQPYVNFKKMETVLVINKNYEQED